MNSEPTQQQANDDPELAKVLTTIDDSAPSTTDDDASPNDSGLQFEEAPVAPAPPIDQPVVDASSNDEVPAPAVPPVDDEEKAPESAPEEPAVPQFSTTSGSSDSTTPSFATEPSASSGELDDIKKDALNELGPLVEKLSLPADEKFDIMLLIIRSTDDQSLVAAAHKVAKSIEDETKRAQALLDIVKEIDYFATQHNA